MAEGFLEAKDAQELSRARQLADVLQRAAQWIPPASPEVAAQLEWFRDLKFGLMIHWGLYNQVGIKESWPLVDNEWSKWQFKPGTSNREVKEMYMQLHRGFLPLRFDPEEWAEAADNAGFKYLIFTTKHHDGFCMWDTDTTDYKTTGPQCPYRNNKHADITRALWDAFRARGMGIWAYFSRADFACPHYWEEGYLWQDGTVRLPSYDPAEKPEVWKKFQEYVRAQLTELCTRYGRVDCLWYDGGCDGSLLGLPEMTEEMRRYQPWLLGVIRGGTNICQDFLTPELVIPDAPLDVPWEACTVMGKAHKEYGSDTHTSFGYSYDQEYMSAGEIATLLLDVVAKGGNLALNLAPQPDGRLPHRALENLEVFSHWIKVFGEGIFGCRTVSPYRSGPYAFTQKDGRVYCYYIYEPQEAAAPASYNIPLAIPVTAARDLRSGEALPFHRGNGQITLHLPDALIGRPGDIADCFALTVE